MSIEISQLPTVKVTQLDRIDALKDSDMFYVVAKNEEDNESKQCTYDAIKSSISSHLNIGIISSYAYNAYNTSNSNTDKIRNNVSNINSISIDLIDAKDNIEKLLISTDNLCIDLNTVSARTNPATSSDYGTIKLGYNETGNNHPVLLNEDGQAYVTVAGSGGGDVDIELRHISSFYGDIDNKGVYVNKVDQLSLQMNELSAKTFDNEDSLSVQLDDCYNLINEQLYCVGAIYTSISVSADAIPYLAAVFSSDNAQWEEINTVLSDNIHFYKRIS